MLLLLYTLIKQEVSRVIPVVHSYPVFVALMAAPVVAQPSGGPYGPTPQTYEVPTDADIVIDTSDLSPAEATREVLLYLERQGYIPAPEAG